MLCNYCGGTMTTDKREDCIFWVCRDCGETMFPDDRPEYFDQWEEEYLGREVAGSDHPER